MIIYIMNCDDDACDNQDLLADRVTLASLVREMQALLPSVTEHLK